MPVKKQQEFCVNTPFDLKHERAYAAWREKKLAEYPSSRQDLMLDIENPHALSESEAAGVRDACARANMAFYRMRSEQYSGDGKSLVTDLGRQFGLHGLDSNMYADDDGVSALQVSAESRRFDYIPYSNRAISWHTDGYYNLPPQRIRGMILHCVRPADSGGDNTVIDHEIIYLQLRDENPAYIEALMHPQAMTIPANIENGEEIRAAVTGPVFSLDQQTGHLHMRYTARTRSIEWRRDPITQAAVKYLQQLLAQDSPYVFHHRLAAGEGIICNNVLHKRSAFTDNADTGRQRLLYRARYYERIE